jgi:hypothetical protein
MSYLRARLLVEAAAAAAGLAASILALLLPDWVEVLTGFGPDHYGGSVEWLIAGIFLAFTAAASAKAGREWRRLRAASAMAP